MTCPYLLEWDSVHTHQNSSHWCCIWTMARACQTNISITFGLNR